MQRQRSKSERADQNHSYNPDLLVVQSEPSQKADSQVRRQSDRQSAHLNLKTGAQGRIRTSVARKERQIYSLLPLTTRPPVQTPRWS